MKKKILIKGTSIQPNRYGFISGIGRSNVELINGLLSLNDPDIEFSCYCVGIKSLRKLPYKWPIKYYSFPILGRYHKSFDFWLEPFFRKFIVGNDLVHITGNYAGIWGAENIVLTIHDLIEYEIQPWTRVRFEKCAKYAKAIFTCSNFTKREIIRILGVPEEKIHVIYWGLNHNLFYKRNDAAIKEVLSKYNISTPYFFSCSGSDPTNRKNADITMAAFRKLLESNPDITLVITWMACPEQLKNEFAQEMSEGKIVLLNGVSDEELVCLYSGALASYFISSAEGFGFPVLESFACGTPCVTCRNTSLTEIGADKAYFVKERDVEDTLQSMLHFAQNGKGDTESLIKYAKEFTWARTAKEYMEVYKSVLNI